MLVRCPMCASWSSVIPSQPSQLDSSALVHSDESRAHRRRILWFFDLNHVAIARVLCAGARPKQTLGLRSALLQPLPTRTTEQLLVPLVGYLCVRNRNFSQQ